jgi:hypothetical protein
MMTEVKGGLSREQKINLRTEAKVGGGCVGAPPRRTAGGRQRGEGSGRAAGRCGRALGRRHPRAAPPADAPPPPDALRPRATRQAPFRFARTFIFGGLAAGAGLGLIVILGRLAKSLQGEAGRMGGVRREGEGGDGSGAGGGGEGAGESRRPRDARSSRGRRP